MPHKTAPGVIRIRGAGRQEYYERLQFPLKLELLAEAYKRRDQALLKRALADAKTAGITDDWEIFGKCQRELEVVQTREALADAIKRHDVHDLRKLIEVIKSNPMYLSQLQHDVIDAEREANRLARVLWGKQSVLYMNKKAMSELRRFHNPPQLVKDIMQGVLLLFNVDEQSSKNWKVCQSYVNPHGPRGMSRKVVEFDPTTVHPAVAARTRQILDDFSLQSVQAVSSALATFYVWAQGMVDDVLAFHDTGGLTPANIKKQKELFNPDSVSKDSSASSRNREFVH